VHILAIEKEQRCTVRNLLDHFLGCVDVRGLSVADYGEPMVSGKTKAPLRVARTDGHDAAHLGIVLLNEHDGDDRIIRPEELVALAKAGGAHERTRASTTEKRVAKEALGHATRTRHGGHEEHRSAE
jgi:hypothetical protein